MLITFPFFVRLSYNVSIHVLRDAVGLDTKFRLRIAFRNVCSEMLHLTL